MKGARRVSNAKYIQEQNNNSVVQHGFFGPENFGACVRADPKKA